MAPRITLITPSFQQRQFVLPCLASVHDQGYENLEHIVVDGGSTDGSKEVIAQFADKLAWWCSEADRGQSHAINKGLEHATGDVFGWLNSDDLLLPGALQRVGDAFAADPELQVFGGQRLLRTEGKDDRPSPLDDASHHDGLFLHPQVNQQSTFYRMDAVRTIGGVEEGLHYTMDLELWWQVLFANAHVRSRFDEVPLAVFRFHGDAKTATGGNAFRDETAIILHHMAVQLDQHDLAIVLETGYAVDRALRPMPLEVRHIPIVRRMIVYFLLKWHNTIHDRQAFEMMRHFSRTIQLNEDRIESEQRSNWKKVTAQTVRSSWTAFRIKRKLDHLFT